MPVPTTPSIDNFDRADENPATGWTQLSGVANPLKVLSNKLRSAGTTPAYGGGYYPTVFSGGNVEHYWQVGSSPVVGWTEDWFYLMSDSGAQSPIRFGFINGYCLRGAYPAADQMRIQRWDASSPTELGAAPTAWTWAAEDWLWVKVTAGTHRVYAKHSADPEYTLLATVTDATYTSGVFGWRSQSGSDATDPGTIDSLGGGVPAVTQNLRPDADVTTTGWTATPLWSKIEEETADGTIVTATAS